MKFVLKKCKRELALFLIAALAWTGINVTQAFLLEYISETALEGLSGRLALIVAWALGYVILEAALEFAFSWTELNVRSKTSALLAMRYWSVSWCAALRKRKARETAIISP